jgi:hypothetical protein
LLISVSDPGGKDADGGRPAHDVVPLPARGSIGRVDEKTETSAERPRAERRDEYARRSTFADVRELEQTARLTLCHFLQQRVEARTLFQRHDLIESSTRSVFVSGREPEDRSQRGVALDQTKLLVPQGYADHRTSENGRVKMGADLLGGVWARHWQNQRCHTHCFPCAQGTEVVRRGTRDAGR